MAQKTEEKAFLRSPSYPSISLKRAVELSKELYQKVRKNKVGAADAMQEMGFNPAASTGQRALAAIISYGILEAEGARGDRQVKLSGLGLDLVLHSEGSEEHTAAKRKAALKPNLHAWAAKKWHDGLPGSDQIVRSSFMREFEFNDKAIDIFIEELRETFAYAGFDAGGILEDEIPSEEDQEEKNGGSDSPEIQPKPKTFPPANPPKPMIALKSETQDYTIPLIGNEIAVLRLPIPLSKKNLEVLSGYIELMKTTVDDVKPVLYTPPQPPSPESKDDE